MIPPTSIDGTDITGATIDGTDVTEITVDGDTVFTAERIIDDFEDGNINEYSGDTGSYSVTSSNPIGGSDSLSGQIDLKYVHSNSGLNNYPQAGDTFSFKMRVEGNINVASGMVFGVQSTTSQNYCLRYDSETGTDRVRVKKNVSSGNFGTTIGDFNLNQNFTNDVFRFEIDWGINGNISFDVFNENTSTNVGSGSFTDTDYTNGGIGWFTAVFTQFESNPSRVLFDDAVIL